MDIRRAIPIVLTDDPEGSRAFYAGFLGFRVAMEEDGMLMFVSESQPTTQVIVAWDSPTALDPAARSCALSVEVGDVDAAYALARSQGLEIVREIADEPWGIRRFFVRDPSGRTVNVAAHIAR